MEDRLSGGDLVAELRTAMRGATRRLSGAPAATLREHLAALVAEAGGLTGADGGALLDAYPDTYGDGVVAALERRVADLLGMPDAAYFPSGTMAQQVALRCWARETGSEVVATHPLSHLEVHERHAYRDLTGLRGLWPTSEPRLPTAADVAKTAERFGTLTLELPMRDAGFLLPDWDELVEVTAAARGRGARVHFDGARLWESAAHYGRPLAQLAGLADSVYVSFYKSLGGVSGAAVAGPAGFVAQLKEWRHRYGGQIYQQWPAVLTALVGIERELPRLPEYVAHAKTVAAALAEAASAHPGVRVYPEPPHTHQFRLWVPFEARTMRRAAIGQIEESGLGLFDRWIPGQAPGTAYTEVSAAAAALDWSAGEITAALLDLLARAAGPGGSEA
jgi:threonine aldolase